LPDAPDKCNCATNPAPKRQLCVFNDFVLVKAQESSIVELPVLTSELAVQIQLSLPILDPLVDCFVWNLTFRDGVCGCRPELYAARPDFSFFD
jgi:hypothetical protein